MVELRRTSSSGFLASHGAKTITTVAACLCCIGLVVFVTAIGDRPTLKRATIAAQFTQTPSKASKLATPPNKLAELVPASEDRQQEVVAAAARSQLADFKDRLLSSGIPFFGVGRASKGKHATNIWKSLEPIVSCPIDRPVTRYGSGGDGGKLLCKLPQHADADCVIYSLGSNGQYDFEVAVLNETSCSVHTFDCTYDGKSQGPRHSYYKWCVGDQKNGSNFRSWANITATLNHSKVDVLKIDIEGHEYKVFSDWKATDASLPDQIAAEFHFTSGAWGNTPGLSMAQSGAEMALAFFHLAHLGYAEFSQEVNPYNPECCAEFSFLNVATL